MPSSLPIETIEEIIDYLHNDRTSLLACSLASSSSRVRAQHHLFRSIDVLDEYAARRFPLLLAASPHLAAHIRVVQLGIDFPDCIPHCALPHVTDLALYLRNTGHLALTPAQRDQIGRVFPGVHTLTIDTANFSTWKELVHLLRVFPRLASLCLHFVNIVYRDPDPALSQAPPLSFTTLILEDCYGTVADFWIAHGSILPHMPQLRYLRILCAEGFGEYQLHEGAALAAHSASTLEDLVIEVKDLEKIKVFVNEYKRAHGSVALSALRSLRLRTNEGDDAEGDLAEAARLALEIARDSQTQIELSTAAGSWHTVWNRWTAQLAGPHWRWRCTNAMTPDVV